MKYFFKSLDTWLEGTCKSYCEEHHWRDDRDLWASDKYSIFADPEDENPAEQMDNISNLSIQDSTEDTNDLKNKIEG